MTTDSPLTFEALKKLKESRLFRILVDFRELIAVALFFTPFLKAVFGSPVLEVSYEQTRLLSPQLTHAQLVSLPGKLAQVPAGLRQFVAFTESPQFLEIKIVNYSTAQVTDLDLKIRIAQQIVDSAVSSTSSRIDPNLAARWKLSNDLTASFPEFKIVPPNSTTTLVVWGKFQPPLLGDLITVSSSAESTRTTQAGRVSGIRLFVAQNLNFVTFVLAAGLALLGFSRSRRSIT